MKPTGPTNEQLRELLRELQPQAVQSRFWKRIIAEIARPTRQRREVNVYKLNKYSRDGETVLVPGKVLSVGELNKKVHVAAMSFSAPARQKIENAQGKALSIRELLKLHPDGKNVRIIG